MFYLFLRQRETEHEQGRGRERGRHRIWSRLQAPSCQHRDRHGARTHRPWDHDLSRSRTLNRLSHPGAPVGLTPSPVQGSNSRLWDRDPSQGQELDALPTETLRYPQQDLRFTVPLCVYLQLGNFHGRIELYQLNMTHLSILLLMSSWAVFCLGSHPPCCF